MSILLDILHLNVPLHMVSLLLSRLLLLMVVILKNNMMKFILNFLVRVKEELGALLKEPLEYFWLVLQIQRDFHEVHGMIVL